jgi:hypothetical protein
VHLSCVPARLERTKKAAEPFQFIYKPLAVFSPLISGGPCRAQALKRELAGESFGILFIE